jgi:SAM-dependent methyltransferase
MDRKIIFENEKTYSQWDKIYKNKGLSYVSNLSSWNDIVNFLKDKKIKKVLDVGCGTGAHLMKLAKEGFVVVGIDKSSEAILIAKKLFDKENIKAKLVVGDIHNRFPFGKESFEAVISLRTLNHGDFLKIRRTVLEIERVLVKKGIVFITVQKVLGLGFRNNIGVVKLNDMVVDFVKPRTYIKMEGSERGITHYVFNKNILLKLFHNFKILSLWVDYGRQKWEKYYCLLAIKIH